MSVSNRKVTKEIPDLCQIDILDVQAGLVNRKLGYTPWKWEEELTVLTMDHFQLPFTILVREMNIRNFVDNFPLIRQLHSISMAFDKFLIHIKSGLGLSFLCFIIEILIGRLLS